MVLQLLLEKDLRFTLSVLLMCVTQPSPCRVLTDIMPARLYYNKAFHVHAQDLLQEVKAGPWETLARRRVQHFGFKFEYVVCSRATLSNLLANSEELMMAANIAQAHCTSHLQGFVVQSRNVDLDRPIHPLPPFAQQIAYRLGELLGVAFDQLTVNKYEPGVGLSAHVDTHSAFTGRLSCLGATSLYQVTAFDRPRPASGDTLRQRTVLWHSDTSWHHDFWLHVLALCHT